MSDMQRLKHVTGNQWSAFKTPKVQGITDHIGFFHYENRILLKSDFFFAILDGPKSRRGLDRYCSDTDRRLGDWWCESPGLGLGRARMTLTGWSAALVFLWFLCRSFA